MILSLSSHDYQQLLIWAKQAHPQECCGLIWANKKRGMHVDKLELTKNIANNPLKYFEIDPKSLFAANRKKRASDNQLIGIFHSHPNGLGIPSEQDANDVNEIGQIWIIIANESIQGWISAKNGEINGKFDPLTLNIVN